MSKIANTRTFRSGNGVAVEIPEEFDLPEGVEVELVGDGSGIMIRPRKKKMTAQELVEALRAIGPPPDGVQEREAIEFPDRPGLY